MAQFGVGLFVVRHRRHQAGLQRLDRDDVLDPGAHRMTGEALGVGDDDRVGVGTEHLAQRVDLGRRAAAAGRRVRLVRDEHRLARDACRSHPAGLGLPEPLHHVANVLDVEPGAVERAVRGHRAQDFADRLEPAFGEAAWQIPPPEPRPPCRGSSRAGAGRRGGGLLDHVVGGGRAGCQESRPDPGQQRVGGRRRPRRPPPPAGSGRRGSSRRPRHSACVVLAQAALTCVFGPRAPMISANCECPWTGTGTESAGRTRTGRSRACGTARGCAGPAPTRPARRRSSARAPPPARSAVPGCRGRCSSSRDHGRSCPGRERRTRR